MKDETDPFPHGLCFGCAEDLERFMELSLPELWPLARSRSRDDEMAQEVITRLFEGFASQQQPAREFASYRNALYFALGVLPFRAIDVANALGAAQDATRTVEAGLTRPGARVSHQPESPETTAQRRQALAVLYTALDGLTPLLRDLLDLKIWKDLAWSEITDELNERHGTDHSVVNVSTNLYRQARQVLGALLPDMADLIDAISSGG